MDASGLQEPSGAPHIDWQQVLLNGGPPCFFVKDGRYCGRAKRWQGHGAAIHHDFVSLDDLLTTVRKEERAAATRRLQSRVVVEEGNTEVNEAYFEVKFLGEVIWQHGGPRTETEAKAARAADRFKAMIQAAANENKEGANNERLS